MPSLKKLLCNNAQEIFAPTDTSLIANNGATFSTTVKKFGSKSGRYVGQSQDFTTSTEVNLGSGNVTMECWWYPTAFVTAYYHYFFFPTNGYNGAFCYNTAGYRFEYYDDATANVYRFWGYSTPTLNTWYHLAIVRNGSNVNLFINGIQQTVSGSVGNVGNQIKKTFKLGGTNHANSSGYIDEVRFSSIARYAANFTPPASAFTTDENTKGLYHFEQ